MKEELPYQRRDWREQRNKIGPWKHVKLVSFGEAAKKKKKRNTSACQIWLNCSAKEKNENVRKSAPAGNIAYNSMHLPTTW